MSFSRSSLDSSNNERALLDSKHTLCAWTMRFLASFLLLVLLQPVALSCGTCTPRASYSTSNLVHILQRGWLASWRFLDQLILPAQEPWCTSESLCPPSSCSLPVSTLGTAWVAGRPAQLMSTRTSVPTSGFSGPSEPSWIKLISEHSCCCSSCSTWKSQLASHKSSPFYSASP